MILLKEIEGNHVEIEEKNSVSLKTDPQISFGRGTVVSKKYFTKPKQKLEIEKGNSLTTFVEFIV